MSKLQENITVENKNQNILPENNGISGRRKVYVTRCKKNKSAVLPPYENNSIGGELPPSENNSIGGELPPSENNSIGGELPPSENNSIGGELPPSVNNSSGLKASPFSMNNSSGFGSHSSGFGSHSSRFGSQSSGFGSQSSGFGSQSSGFGSQSSGFGASFNAFKKSLENNYVENGASSENNSSGLRQISLSLSLPNDFLDKTNIILENKKRLNEEIDKLTIKCIIHVQSLKKSKNLLTKYKNLLNEQEIKLSEIINEKNN